MSAEGAGVRGRHDHATVLTERQRVEASVYDARVRAALASVSDADLAVDADVPPYPNREHVDFLWLPWREAADRCFSPSNAEAILQLPRFVGTPCGLA